MRILIVVPWVGTAAGGAAAASLAAARSLAARGHDVDLHATDAALPSNARGFRRLSVAERVAAEAAAHPATLHLHASSRPHRLAWSRSLEAALPTAVAAADVVDAHGCWLRPVVAAPLAARRAGTPWLVWPHGALSPAFSRRGRLRKAAAWRLGQRAALTDAAGIVVSSAIEASWVRDALARGDEDRTELPIHEVPLPVEPSARPRPLALDDRDRTLLWAGRLAPVKRPDRAIRLLAGLAPDLGLVIAGPDGSGMRDELLALARSLGVADRVTLTGELDAAALRERMARSIATLVTSDTENWSLVAAESLAEGTPVIVGPRVGIGALVAAAGAGIVLGESPDGWASNARAILDGAGAWNDAAASARVVAATLHPDRVTDALEAVHLAALGCPVGRPAPAAAAEAAR